MPKSEDFPAEFAAYMAPLDEEVRRVGRDLVSAVEQLERFEAKIDSSKQQAQLHRTIEMIRSEISALERDLDEAEAIQQQANEYWAAD